MDRPTWPGSWLISFAARRRLPVLRLRRAMRLPLLRLATVLRHDCWLSLCEGALDSGPSAQWPRRSDLTAQGIDLIEDGLLVAIGQHQQERLSLWNVCIASELHGGPRQQR